MRRAEMARRRKNLSEKRNEEEKVFNTHVFLLVASLHMSSCFNIFELLLADIKLLDRWTR